jgi:hypothetical protein
MNDGSCFIIVIGQDLLVPPGATMVLPQVPQTESLVNTARRRARFGRYETSPNRQSGAATDGYAAPATEKSAAALYESVAWNWHSEARAAQKKLHH